MILSFDQVYNTIRPGEAMLYGLKTIDRCLDHWRAVQDVSKLDGDLIEVGVWRGGTSVLAAAQMKNTECSGTLYMCDTWTGISKDQTSNKDLYIGGEHADAKVEDVVEVFRKLGLTENPPSEIFVGLFPKETGKIVETKRFKYVSLDVDIFEATSKSFEFLWKRMVPGGILIIDDYNWPRTPGITEFCKSLNLNDIYAERQQSSDNHFIIKKLKVWFVGKKEYVVFKGYIDDYFVIKSREIGSCGIFELSANKTWDTRELAETELSTFANTYKVGEL